MARLLKGLVWLTATAVVAFLVARATTERSAETTEVVQVPLVDIGGRATVTLSEKSITSIVSADGIVVRNGDGWMLEAPAPTHDLAYRLLDPPIRVKAGIKGGPSGFECRWIGLGQGGAASIESARSLIPDAPVVTMRCEVPSDVRAAAGMFGTMVLQMSEPVSAWAVPVTAVIGDAEHGLVVVVDDDQRLEVREVTLGVADIYNIEVLSGLQQGEAILQNPTQSDVNAARKTE